MTLFAVYRVLAIDLFDRFPRRFATRTHLPAARFDIHDLSPYQLHDIGIEPPTTGPLFEIEARTMTGLMALR